MTFYVGIDIIILNEDHTLGNIIQSHFNYYDELNKEFFFPQNKNIRFVGYNEPHPLDKKIVLRIGLTQSYVNKKKYEDDNYTKTNDIKKILATCLNKVIRLCKTLNNDFEKI